MGEEPSQPRAVVSASESLLLRIGPCLAVAQGAHAHCPISTENIELLKSAAQTGGLLGDINSKTTLAQGNMVDPRYTLTQRKTLLVHQILFPCQSLEPISRAEVSLGVQGSYFCRRGSTWLVTRSCNGGRTQPWHLTRRRLCRLCFTELPSQRVETKGDGCPEVCRIPDQQCRARNGLAGDADVISRVHPMPLMLFPRFARHSPHIPQTTPVPSDAKHMDTTWTGDMQPRFSLG